MVQSEVQEEIYMAVQTVFKRFELKYLLNEKPNPPAMLGRME